MLGMNVDVAALDTKVLASYTTAAHSQSTVDFLLNVVPNTVVDAFAKGEILQVLLFSVLFGFALCNGVATIVVSKWERELDHAQTERGLRRDVENELEEEARLKHAAARTAAKPS
jgi:Na+/H+-dicarboxylate symporter